MEKVFKINDKISLPMNFGIGAFEAFMEANQVDDITKIQELFTGPEFLKNIRAFMLCCAQYYCEIRDQECTLTLKDITKSIDLTGGFKSTFVKEFVSFFMDALGVEETPDESESSEETKN